VVLTNIILVSHTVGIWVTPGNAASLNGVLFFGNGVDTGGAGTINVTNAALPGDPTFASDGYRLTSDSAAIGQEVPAGVPTDMDGEPRDATNPDLGADEYVTAEVCYDVTGDHQVTVPVAGLTRPSTTWCQYRRTASSTSWTSWRSRPIGGRRVREA